MLAWCGLINPAIRQKPHVSMFTSCTLKHCHQYLQYHCIYIQPREQH